jgi:hypothetical protein
MDASHPQQPVDEGPPPMLWSDYEKSLKESYTKLLSAKPTESEMQRFLERNPTLVPGAFPDHVGHGAFPNALITQPELSGIGERRPDFMWIARSSAMVQPVLIEIESPSKRWVVGKGKHIRQSADFTQAMTQLRQWEEWLAKPANRDVLLERYGVPADWGRRRAFHPQFWLICGRSGENPDEIAKLRAYHGLRSLNVITYDNLRRPNEWCKNYLTIRSRGDGTYKAIYVPPTAKWTAGSPESWAAVKDRARAVSASEIPEGRKRYLVEQIPAWDAWAAYWLERGRGQR